MSQLIKILCMTIVAALIPSGLACADGEMVFVEGGCFKMGDLFGDGLHFERPVHKVCVDDFYIDKYEVTQKQFASSTGGYNPSGFRNCDNCPVENVNWLEARKYCDSVGKRLPTEAEWEYAARSRGKKQKFAGTSEAPDAYGWYKSNSGGKTHPVGQKKPNELGLYDMTGNVWEFVSDWFADDYYRRSPEDNPRGPEVGKRRVLRGGSWTAPLRNVRVFRRIHDVPESRYDSHGIRCARSRK